MLCAKNLHGRGNTRSHERRSGRPGSPGAIENGKSSTPAGHFTTGPRDATAGAADNGGKAGSSPWAWWYRCKMWWTDPDTKEISPVYAGLPFIRLNGPPTLGYAIHGPIDKYGIHVTLNGDLYMTGHPTVACSLRNSETSSGGAAQARHCCAGRAKIWSASHPSARPRAMAFQAPPATDS